MKFPIFNKITTYILVFILSLISTLTYGEHMFKAHPQYSMFLFNVSMVVSTFTLNLFTKIDSALLSSPIVETYEWIDTLFEDFRKKTPDGALINTTVSVFLGTAVFGMLSLGIGKTNIGRFSKFVPISVLLGILGAIGMSQFDLAFREKRWVLRLGTLFLALIKFLLQRFFPKKNYLVILFGLVFVLIFNFVLPKMEINDESLYGKDFVLYRAIADLEKGEMQFGKISFGAILGNIRTILTMSLFCLIHLPLYLLPFKSQTNIDACLDKEMIAQGLSNIASSISVFPSYFAYNSSIFMNKSPSKKIEGFIMGALLVFIMLVAGKTSRNVPRFYLASFPTLIGMTLCYSALLEHLGETNPLEYVITVAVMLLGWKYDPIYAFLAGILLCAALNLFYYIRSLQLRKHRDMGAAYRKHLEPLLVSENIDYLVINYVLFFGTIGILERDFLSLKSHISVVDVQNCYSVDMLANKVLQRLVSRSEQFFVVVGNPRSFRLSSATNVAIVSDYNEAADVIQRRLCNI